MKPTLLILLAGALLLAGCTADDESSSDPAPGGGANELNGEVEVVNGTNETQPVDNSTRETVPP